VGIAAHEAGHALQHAHGYAPLAIRNAAVPVASFGAPVGGVLIMIGFLIASATSGQSGWASNLIWLGIALFGATVFFQIVNLPVEFNASSRAKAQLAALGIVHEHNMPYVNSVLNAAAWTYVAATLQSILVLAYYIFRVAGSSNRD
jgi:Zn-dependent membrane protease YugP